MAQAQDTYPVGFEVDYPDRDLNRVTTGFRIFVAIPILIVLGVLVSQFAGTDNSQVFLGGAGLLFLAPLLLILFREKYPRWWFDWNRELLAFMNRIWAYLLLLDDTYPSTDEEQAVHLDLTHPEVGRDINRWLGLVKWFLAIPHYIVLIFLHLAAYVLVIIAWFAILFTGRYPRGIFDFQVGVMRWHNRVVGYAFILVTDRYPPFSLQA